MAADADPARKRKAAAPAEASSKRSKTGSLGFDDLMKKLQNKDEEAALHVLQVLGNTRCLCFVICSLLQAALRLMLELSCLLVVQDCTLSDPQLQQCLVSAVGEGWASILGLRVWAHAGCRHGWCGVAASGQGTTCRLHIGRVSATRLRVQPRVPQGAPPTPHSLAHASHQVVQTLLEGGADPNLGSDAYSPVHTAASGGHAAVLHVLLDAKADPTRRSRDHTTALHLAGERLTAAGVALC